MSNLLYLRCNTNKLKGHTELESNVCQFERFPLNSRKTAQVSRFTKRGALASAWIKALALFWLSGVQEPTARAAFAPAANYVAAPAQLVAVASADVNGDGKMDLISVNGSGGTLTVLTNSGGGHYGSNATYTVGGAALSVAAADVNGDSRIDLICGSSSPGRITVLTNDGSGRFAISTTLVVGTSGRAYSVATADVNGDGKPDVISVDAVSGAGSLYVYTNNGIGGFALSSKPGVGSDPFSVVAADINGDSWPDLICANYQGNSLSVLTNDGAGGFALASTPSVGSFPICVVAADVNGDGSLDLISANSGGGPSGNSLTVLTNSANGHFALTGTYAVGTNPCAVMAMDASGTGRIDLVSANFVDNTVSVLTNDGSGGFALESNWGVGVNPRGATAADVNGDGHADVITANFGAGTVSVLINVPRLAIERAVNDVVVFWPSSWTNWTLLQNSNAGSATWSPSIGVANDGTNRSLTIPSPTNKQFYRLSYP